MGKKVWRGYLAIVVGLAMVLSVTAPTRVAEAHNIDGCGKKKVTFSLQPDAHLHSKIIFEHTNRVYSYTSISLYWGGTYCGASAGTHSDFVDLYNKNDIQELSGGTYSTCYTDTAGWQGNQNDPYVNEMNESSIVYWCDWFDGGNSVRGKVLSKFQQSDGTVHSVWGVTGAHAGG